MTAYKLPKWPQMVVTGQSVTVEQAKEIIRRTDRFFVMLNIGGDSVLRRRISELLRVPAHDATDWDATYAREDAWRERWGVIPTEYVRNEWVATSYVGGPHGWCHPDGSIGFAENVGKWPSVEDVQGDWQALLDAFPFLDLGVTLMDREDCEDGALPVVSMRVRSGTVELVDPHSVNVHAGHVRPQSVDWEADLERRMRSDAGEVCGVPEAWFFDWARCRSLSEFAECAACRRTVNDCGCDDVSPRAAR